MARLQNEGTEVGGATSPRWDRSGQALLLTKINYTALFEIKLWLIMPKLFTTPAHTPWESILPAQP